MALEMAKMRGWGVERVGSPHPVNNTTRPYYRVYVPMGPNHATGIWEIENDARGANRLIGLLMREAA